MVTSIRSKKILFEEIETNEKGEVYSGTEEIPAKDRRKNQEI